MKEMTKVNENGQLEWIFEELDLEGEARLVRSSISQFMKFQQEYLDRGRNAQGTVLREVSFKMAADCELKWRSLQDVYFNLKSLIEKVA